MGHRFVPLLLSRERQEAMKVGGSGFGLAVASVLATAHGVNAAQRRASGRIEYATAGRLYLDAGARDGISPGAVLQLQRGERLVSTCRVEAVSATHATCVGAGQPGDTFTLSASAPAATPAAERPAPPLSDAETARRHHALQAATYERVEFRGAPAMAGILSGRTEVQLAHATWASQNVGPWHQERLDVSVRGAPVGGGFALYADLSARRWSLRSGPVAARPDDRTQLYVWEAEVARRPARDGLALAFGRVRPWSAPGSSIIDGGQAGWRLGSNVELGVFGGAIPDPVTLAPSFERMTAGAYLAFRGTGEVSSIVRYFRQETRFAYLNSPELGKRFEAEALGQMSLGRVLDLGVEARVAGGDRQSPDYLDAGSVDVGFRPLERLSFLGGFRYTAVSVPERDGPGAALSGGASRHADVTATWEFASWLLLSGVSGLSKDLTTGLSRRYAGPEVGLPRLLGDVGGVSFGFVAEDGWTGGHTAWAQVLTRRPRWLQVLFRASWFQTSSLGAFTADEIGAYASISAQLAPAVALRIAALGRAGGGPGVRPFGQNGSLLGGTIDAALAGRF